MKKIYIMGCLLSMLPMMSYGENARIAELARQKQEKMERLQKCEGTTKALKIAGLSTIGLTAVGVVGNVVEAQKLQQYQSQSKSLDSGITKTKQEIADKKAEIAKKKQEEADAKACMEANKDKPFILAMVGTENGGCKITECAENTHLNSAETDCVCDSEYEHNTTTGKCEKKQLASDDTNTDGISAKGYNKDGACSVCENSEECSKVSASTCNNLIKEQWEVQFSYGLVSGKSKCSSTNGTYLQSGNPVSSDGQYCWCQVLTNENRVQASSPSWVFYIDDRSASECEGYCAIACAYGVLARSDFRAALFGSTGI